MRRYELLGSTTSSRGGRSGRGPSRALAIGLVLLVVGPLVGAPATGASASQSAVDSCRTIDEPGVYTLARDLESSGGVCIRIAASNVTLNGAGHAIEGDGEGVGVRTNASGLHNVSVTNLTVSGWTVGVHYRSVDGGRVANVTADGNREGIALQGSRDLQVRSNLVRANDHQGVRLVDTHDSVVAGNVALENVADGFLLKGSTNDTLRANVARDNGEEVGADGFMIVDGSDGTEIRRNLALNNTDDGIDVQDSSENTIVGNNASFNVGVVNADGIQIKRADDNVVRNNVANGNVDDGIDLQRANDNTVTRNVASENVNDGIPLANAQGNLVRGNVANNNSKVDREITDRMLPDKELEEDGSEGFTVRGNASRNNTLVGNTASGNHRQGIRVWLGTRRNNVTNNTVTDNGADGITVLNASGNDVARNEVRRNDRNGIHLGNGASDNEVTRNRIHGNRLNGIFLHTAKDTLAVGNVVTENGADPGGNGIRIGDAANATLLNNPTSDNDGANVRVVSSSRVRVLESWGVSVTDSRDVTVVHSPLLKDAVPTALRRTPGPGEAGRARTIGERRVSHQARYPV